MIEFYRSHTRSRADQNIKKLSEEAVQLLKLLGANAGNLRDGDIGLENAPASEDPVLKWNRISGLISSEARTHSFLRKYLSRDTNHLEDRPRFADLFAGCGGFSKGLEGAGFGLAFVNEINLQYAETHFFNHSLDSEHYFIDDIHELVVNIDQFQCLRDLELIVGGPPCQGFSMANRQRVIDDPRNHLYKAFLEVLSECQPQIFIMENVRGMTNKMSEILEDFEYYLGTKFDLDFAILNAKDFGVPQNRERVFIVGNRLGMRSSKLIENVLKRRTSNFVLRDAISDLPALSPKRIKNDNTIENEEVGFTFRRIELSPSPYKRFINGEKDSELLLNHKNRYNNDRDIEIFRRLPQGANSLDPSISEIMPYKSRSGIFKDKYYRLREDLPCKTITSHMRLDCNMYIHPNQPRGLSPREAARVQSFPDDFYFRGPQNSWYAQVGNAVPVKLAEAIGQGIVPFLD